MMPKMPMRKRDMPMEKMPKMPMKGDGKNGEKKRGGGKKGC